MVNAIVGRKVSASHTRVGPFSCAGSGRHPDPTLLVPALGLAPQSATINIEDGGPEDAEIPQSKALALDPCHASLEDISGVGDVDVFVLIEGPPCWSHRSIRQ